MRKHITRSVTEKAKAGDAAYQIHDTLIPGFVLRIQPSGKKIWKLIIKRKPQTLGQYPAMTTAQAQAKARRILNGEEDQPQQHGSVLTLVQFIDQYFQEYVDANHARPNETVAMLHMFAVGDTPLNEIRAAQIERFRNAKRRKGMKPASVNRYVATLKGAMQKAVDWDLIPVNPLARIKPLKLDQSHVVRYLTPDEEDRLHAALPESELWLQTLVILALNSGLRRGELMALTWGDVAGGMITVHGGMAKSKQTRHVPINDTAAKALKKWKGAVMVMPHVKIFPDNYIPNRWARLLRRADIQNFRFHDMRHHFASKLVMAGVPLNTVRELLGHASLTMTLRYSHLAPSNLQDAVAMIG